MTTDETPSNQGTSQDRIKQSARNFIALIESIEAGGMARTELVDSLVIALITIVDDDIGHDGLHQYLRTLADRLEGGERAPSDVVLQ